MSNEKFNNFLIKEEAFITEDDFKFLMKQLIRSTYKLGRNEGFFIGAMTASIFYVVIEFILKY